MSGAHLLLPQAKTFYDSLKGQPHISTTSPADLRAAWQQETPALKLPSNVDKVTVGDDSSLAGTVK